MSNNTPNLHIQKSKKLQDSFESLDILSSLGKTKLGFVNDNVRKKVWVKLLTPDSKNSLETPHVNSNVNSKVNPNVKRQVQVDVQRAFFYHKFSHDSSQLLKYQSTLERVILHVLASHPRYEIS